MKRNETEVIFVRKVLKDTVIYDALNNDGVSVGYIVDSYRVIDGRWETHGRFTPVINRRRFKWGFGSLKEAKKYFLKEVSRFLKLKDYASEIWAVNKTFTFDTRNGSLTVREGDVLETFDGERFVISTALHADGLVYCTHETKGGQARYYPYVFGLGIPPDRTH